jgi:hypothetical protein
MEVPYNGDPMRRCWWRNGNVFWETVHAGAVKGAFDDRVRMIWNGPPAETDIAGQMKVGQDDDRSSENGARRSIDNGWLDSVVIQHPFLMGETAVNEAVKAIRARKTVRRSSCPRA